MKHADVIAKLSLREKCALLSGATVFETHALPNKGVPAIWLSDGPNGLRKQAGPADHLGLNPSEPATCFPTAATVANSWDPALGEEIGKALGEETASYRVNVILGPGLNTKRSPLCGRSFEYFSEEAVSSPSALPTASPNSGSQLLAMVAAGGKQVAGSDGFRPRWSAAPACLRRPLGPSDSQMAGTPCLG